MTDNIHDKGYKRILSKKRNFLQLLKHFVHATWVNEIREEDLELIDKEFIPKDFKEKEADLIYKIKIKDQEIIFYFLFELQSYVDFTMPFRLLIYMVELYKRLFLDVKENERERKEFRLPAIVPCILYNGENAWTAVMSFKDYLSGSSLFKENVIDFQYILFNVNQYTDEQLLAIGNFISSVFLLDKQQNINQLNLNLQRMTRIFRKLTKEEQFDFTDWLKDVLKKKVTRKGNEEHIHAFIENFSRGDVNSMTYAIERLLDRIEEKGLEQGTQKGIHLGNITQIKKKIEKGYQKKQISENLELEEDYIAYILELIQNNPHLSEMELAEIVIKQNFIFDQK